MVCGWANGEGVCEGRASIWPSFPRRKHRNLTSVQLWVQVLGLHGRVVHWLAAVCSCIIGTTGSDLGPLCGRLKVVLVLVGDQVGLDFVS